VAKLIVDRGLQLIADRASGVAGAGGAIATMSVDDSNTAFAAGNTSLGSPTNEFDAALDSTPTRSGQTVTHIMTVPAGSFNGFTIKRIALHNDTAANVTGSSATLIAGIDGQSLAKTADFAVTLTLRILYASA
jgi:hypothetical protein